MEKECCNVKVTETEKGYKIEVTGDDVKEKCKAVIENCCKDSSFCKDFFKKCS